MPRNHKSSTTHSGPVKRRQFLGFAGVAGLSLTGLFPQRPRAGPEEPKAKSITGIQSTSGSAYWDRTDRFEEKLKLLEAAWQRKDYRLARALTNSLRTTVIQEQAEQEGPGTPLVSAARFERVESLPAPWRNWARGWQYCKALTLTETIGAERPLEPVEVGLSFPAEQVASLAREVRVARVAGGVLEEVPCQVYREVMRGNERGCQLLFMAGGSARQSQTFLGLRPTQGRRILSQGEPGFIHCAVFGA